MDWVAQTDPHVVQNNELLNEYKSWIIAQTGIADSGYIDEIHNTDDGSLVLLWHGESPLKQLALEHAAQMGISVAVQERPFSLPEIQQASAQIFAASSALDGAGFTLNSVAGVAADSTDLEVTGELKDKSLTPDEQTMVEANIRALLASIQPIPVRLVFGQNASF